jgi:YVTN family beta-propeller protein
VVSPDGKRAYAGLPAAVSVIDTASNTVVATVSGLSAPFGMAVTPDGKRVYVANFSAPTVSVIDTATNAVVATVTGLQNTPTDLAVTPDGKNVYVSNDDSSTNTGFVSVIDTATNRIAATVKVQPRPFGIAVGPPR